MLKIEDMHVYYGAIHAVKGVSFEVGEGEIVALIGANGAGKSTILKTVSGLMHPRSGSIHFCDQDITHMEAYKLLRTGLAHVPEGRRIFQQMTVQENLEMGAYIKKDVSQKDLETVFNYFPRLKERRKQIAGTLSGGEQQRAALCKVLLREPEVLLLDEPTRGIDVGAKYEIYEQIGKIVAEGKTAIVISSDMTELIGLCDRVYVMNEGRMVGELSGEQITQENIMRCIISNAVRGEAE